MIQYFLFNRSSLDVFSLVFLMLGYTVLVLLILPFHEFAHALVAHWCGDDTAKWQGRLTLNPFKHLDPFGTAMLVLCGFGYAKPVPVNSRNFRRFKRDMVLVALAGPLSNLLMAVAAVALFCLCLLFVQNEQLLFAFYLLFIQIIMRTSVTLAVFNMLPIPPLDGSRLWSTLLPGRWAYTLERYSQYATLAIMVLLFTGVLDGPLNFLTSAVSDLIFALFRLPPL